MPVIGNFISSHKGGTSGGGPSINPDFVFTVDTTNAGSAADTIVLPLLSGGTYSGTIDWGDTSTSSLSYANRSHTYAAGGTYTITISGDKLSGWQFANAGDKAKITEITNWGLFEFTEIRTFQGCSNMDVIATDAPTISTTSFLSNFYNTGITTPDWSAWDMTGVTTYELCFAYSSNFNGNIGNWVTAATANIKQMLQNCTSFNQDLSGWDTSGVTNAEAVLASATSFDSSVANWVLNGTWFRPFNGATAFTGIGVDTWDVSGMTSGQNLFVNCTSFNGDTSGWDTSALLTATNMFYNCDSYDQDMSSWDINQVTAFSGFMQNATGLSTANYDALLIAWDAQGAMSYSGTVNFGTSQYSCRGEAARTSLIAKWGGITDGGLNTSINCDFVSTWDTTQAGSASDTVVLPLLSGGTYSGTIDWGDSSTSSLSYGNRSHTYASGGTYTITISGTIEGWQFNNTGDKAKITDVSNFGDLTITTINAFLGCTNMTISATDAPIIATTNLTNFMANCSSVTTFEGVALMNTGSVTSFLNAFAGMTNFNQNMNGLDISSATSVSKMLKANPNFNNDGTSLDWSNTNNLNMREFMENTPYNGTIDFGQTVTDLGLTLYNNDAFDTSLAGLDITSLSYAFAFMQAATGMSTANYDATLIDWESQLQAAYPSGAGYPYTININFGGSQFTSGGAGETAKNSLVTNFGWTISDGGGI